MPARAQRLQDWTGHRLGGRNPGDPAIPGPTLLRRCSEFKPPRRLAPRMFPIDDQAAPFQASPTALLAADRLARPLANRRLPRYSRLSGSGIAGRLPASRRVQRPSSAPGSALADMESPLDASDESLPGERDADPALECLDRECRSARVLSRVFDSTGTAIQDVASAACIWQRAVASDVGSSVAFGAL